MLRPGISSCRVEWSEEDNERQLQRAVWFVTADTVRGT